MVHLTIGQRCSRWNLYWDGTTHQVSSGAEWRWVSRKAQQSLILHIWQMGSSLIQVQLFVWRWQSSSPWDCGTTYPKDKFFYLPVIFYIKDYNSVDQSRNCRCERKLSPHQLKYVELSHSAWGRANPCPYECPRTANINTQHPWMNTCIQLTTAVYMYRGCNFAGFKPKCKTDFLPWLHHSKFFMQTQYNSEARVKFLKKSTVTATMTK